MHIYTIDMYILPTMYCVYINMNFNIYTNIPVGLGQSRKWLHWKAQWFGVDPRHVAG